VRPARTKRPELVNVITFIGDDYFSELLRPIGLVPNLIVPFTKVEELERLSEAGATAQMCSTLGTFLAAGLERDFGVPEIKSPPPYGLAATDIWLREAARLTAHGDSVEDFIAAEHRAIQPELDAFRAQFAGVRAFVAAGPSHGHSFMSVLQDLGIQLLGGCMLHHDPKLDNGDPAADTLQHVVKNYGNVRYGVCNKQSYELVNLIRKLKPDVLVVRHPSLVVSCAKLGIPTFFVDDEHIALGYRGLLRYGRKISDWLRNPSIERNLARHAPLPYTTWWLDQAHTRFVGEEA
jgi:nitrogenase molybdenum-iron protein alpha chain